MPRATSPSPSIARAPAGTQQAASHRRLGWLGASNQKGSRARAEPARTAADPDRAVMISTWSALCTTSRAAAQVARYRGEQLVRRRRRKTGGTMVFGSACRRRPGVEREVVDRARGGQQRARRVRKRDSVGAPAHSVGMCCSTRSERTWAGAAVRGAPCGRWAEREIGASPTRRRQASTAAAKFIDSAACDVPVLASCCEAAAGAWPACRWDGFADRLDQRGWPAAAGPTASACRKTPSLLTIVPVRTAATVGAEQGEGKRRATKLRFGVTAARRRQMGRRRRGAAWTCRSRRPALLQHVAVVSAATR